MTPLADRAALLEKAQGLVMHLSGVRHADNLVCAFLTTKAREAKLTDGEELAQAIADLAADAVHEEREACCKLVCERCRRREPLEPGPFVGSRPAHRIGSELYICDAWALRTARQEDRHE